MLSVLIQVRRGTFRCEDDKALWRILCLRVLRCLLMERRRHHRKRRDVRREAAAPQSAGDDGCPSPEPADSHLGPEEIVMAYDEFSWATDLLEPEERLIVYMRLEGYKVSEMVRFTGKPRTTIRRMLDEVQARPKRHGGGTVQ